jgi:hypothetical protein
MSDFIKKGDPIPAELQEIFDESQEFERLLRVFGRNLGDIKLSEIREVYDFQKPVKTREIDGREYSVGYSGRLMVPEGTHKARLAQIMTNKFAVKLLFTVLGRDVFLYHSASKDEIDVDMALSLAQQVGKDFNIMVEHKTIEQTGERHASVTTVDGINLP